MRRLLQYCCSRNTKAKGDYLFNLFHNSNPQHGASYTSFDRRMRDDEFDDFLKSVRGWDADRDAQVISKSFTFESFDEAYKFMGKLCAFCWGADVYPAITWENTEVKMMLYSPHFKGLTKREAKIAAFCNDQVHMAQKLKRQQQLLALCDAKSMVKEMVGPAVQRELDANDEERRRPVPETKKLLLWRGGSST